MKVRFAVLADYSNVTLEGKPNIMGVFDIIHASAFPVKHSEMQLFMRFEADISERGQQKAVQVRLINARGENILELNGQISVSQAEPGDFLFYNHVLILRDLVFPAAGDYQFDIYVDGPVYTVPLKVVDAPGGHKG